MLLGPMENNHIREKNINSINTSEFYLSVVHDIGNEAVEREVGIKGEPWLSGLSKWKQCHSEM